MNDNIILIRKIEKLSKTFLKMLKKIINQKIATQEYLILYKWSYFYISSNKLQGYYKQIFCIIKFILLFLDLFRSGINMKTL